MTIWTFFACVLGSFLGTIIGLAAALVLLLWLDQPLPRSVSRDEDLAWLQQLDGGT